MTEIPDSGPQIVRVSFDAAVGVLTAVFDDADVLDMDDVVDDFVAFFDRREPGRLARLQVLVPKDRQGAWRTVLADYLGPSVATLCLTHVDTGRDTSQEMLVVPAVEWVDLRHGQWPHLHEAARAWLGADPWWDARPATDPVAAGITSQLAHARPLDRAEIETTSVIRLLPGFAYRCGVEPEVRVTIRDDLIRLATTPRKGATLRLAASMILPEPVASGAVNFHRQGGDAAAEYRCRHPVPSRGVARVVVHFARVRLAAGPRVPSTEPGLPTEGAVVLLLRGIGRPVVADRPGSKAVGYAAVGAKLSADHFSFKGTGRTPVHIEVVRQGRTLWALGFAGIRRANRAVFVACRLRADLVERLKPNGVVDPEAGVLSAEGVVDDEGFFRLRLAIVETARVRGRLVDSLELDLD